VADSVLGRTNRAFPPVWLSLSLPHESGEVPIDALVNAARGANVPLDISGNPALWGGRLRGDDEAFLMQMSTSGYERANDDGHAGDLIQAHLIETLSSIGREWIDVYFLRVRRAVDEAQLSGALEAMEMARQEGHIRHMGIVCDGSSLATLGMWQFHDAFDLLLVPRNHYDDEAYRTLAPLAKERRVGVVTSRPLNWGWGLPFVALENPLSPPGERGRGEGANLAQAAIADLAKDHPVLVGVRSPDEVEQALSAPGMPVPDLRECLAPIRERFEAESTWFQLEEPWLGAARRRAREVAL
jgi:aryl-alcohol dehydrogenase-like predicted oxidoreductase